MTELDTLSSLELETGGELLELGKSLIAAARIGDTQAVIECVKFGAPFATDWWGMTSLHHAALGGHLDTCETLVRSGILKDARSKVEKTPLHLACQEGHTHVAMFLLANGADIHAADLILMTPLHWAVEREHLDLVEVLLQNGADPYQQNKFDKSCIDIARENENEKILQLLQARRDPYVVNTHDEVKNNRSNKVIPAIFMSRTNPARRTLKKVVAPSNSSNYQKMQETDQDEIRMILEEHGIEMLDGEDANLVASAVGSGRTVILTEAGRQALSLTEKKNSRVFAGSEIQIKKEAPAARTKRTNDEALIAKVSQRYLQAKREARQLRLLYAKKIKEAEEYQNKLQYIALQTLKTPNSKGMATVSIAQYTDDEDVDAQAYDDDTSCSM